MIDVVYSAFTFFVVVIVFVVAIAELESMNK
jgi:hypothetical protein